MKRSGVWLAAPFLSFVMAGCDSGGIQEGAPTGPVTAESAQTDTFKAEMRKNADSMKNTKKPARPKSEPAATK